MGRKWIDRHKWTEEEIEYLREIVPGRGYDETVAMFNEHFGLELTKAQIYGMIRKYKIRSGYNSGTFKKGSIPHNKGKKNWWGVPEKCFKPGSISWKRRPIGDERLRKQDGLIEVKVAQPEKWKLKHRLLYEQAHGKIKDTEYVIFADGNKLNFDLDNLVLLTRAEAIVLFRVMGFKAVDKELTQTALLAARVYLKAKERADAKKEHKGGKSGQGREV